MNELITIESIAKELIYGLDNDIGVVKRGLKNILEQENITLNELREQCWEDSSNVFDKIY